MLASWEPMYRGAAVPSGDRILNVVRGAVPTELRGTLFRLGPDDGLCHGETLGNMFSDANGFVGAFQIGDGQVTLKTAFVETRYYLAEQAAGRRLYSAYATRAPGGALDRLTLTLKDALCQTPKLREALPKAWRDAWSLRRDAGNHVPRMIGGRLVVTGGAGRPYAMDPETLRMKGLETFGGRLPDKEMLMIGTPHFDPSRAKVCYLEMDPATRGVTLWEVDASGHADPTEFPRLPRLFLLHDYAVTPRTLIVPGGGIFLSYARMPAYLLGMAPMSYCFPFRSDQGIEFHVFDRQAPGAPRVHALGISGYPVHVANAYDEGDDVVLDITIHSTDAAVQGYTASLLNSSEPEPFAASLYRVRLCADGRTRMDPLAPQRTVETPTVDPRREGRPHRYVHAMETQRGVVGGSKVVRIDTTQQTEQSFDFGPGTIVSEPLFIPRHPVEGSEEDGWVSVLVYDSARNTHFLSLLDGADLRTEVARIDVGRRLPYLYHGTFAHA
jgi:all-trans-8'-apo-beta-carotenal 15,15'-oxygenase